MKKHQKLLIPFFLLILLIVLAHIVVFVGGCMKLLHLEGASPLLNVGLLLQLCTWIIVIIDINGNEVANRWIWLGAVIIFGNIGSFVYLLNRKGLLGV